mmetsp:Transcript_64663/g.154393  ORF Transcript_64663/g.154393 Transcript_64663/m.154393 type:complete len:234 (+) Transcript_64663:252-953(+)
MSNAMSRRCFICPIIFASSMSIRSARFAGISLFERPQWGWRSSMRSSLLGISSTTSRADTACRPNAYPSSPLTSNLDPSFSQASSRRSSKVWRGASVLILLPSSSFLSSASGSLLGREVCSPLISTLALRSSSSMTTMRCASAGRARFWSALLESPRSSSLAIWSWFHSLFTIFTSDFFDCVFTSTSSSSVDSPSSCRHKISICNVSTSTFSALSPESDAAGLRRRAGDIVSN